MSENDPKAGENDWKRVERTNNWNLWEVDIMLLEKLKSFSRVSKKSPKIRNYDKKNKWKNKITGCGPEADPEQLHLSPDLGIPECSPEGGLSFSAQATVPNPAAEDGWTQSCWSIRQVLSASNQPQQEDFKHGFLQKEKESNM